VASSTAASFFAARSRWKARCELAYLVGRVLVVKAAAMVVRAVVVVRVAVATAVVTTGQWERS
jgi:hypothetical protein